MSGEYRLPSLSPGGAGVNISNTQAAIEAGFALGVSDIKPQDVGGVSFLVSRGAISLTSLERFGLAPIKMRGEIACETPAGFLTYVLRYMDDDTVVFLRRQAGDITAVLDYHHAPGDEAGDPAAAPRAAEHRAYIKATETPEWRRWKALHRTPMTQVAFAEFLEDNLGDIASPDGAQLLELAQKFRVKKDVTFQSNVSLHSGAVNLSYAEDVSNGGTTAGQIAIPETFILGIAPYQGNQPFQVKVRFRYRLQDGGKLSVWIDIVQIEEVLLAAFDELVTQIKTGLGAGAPVFIEGTAPTREQVWGA